MRIGYFLKKAASDPVVASGYFQILSRVAFRRMRHQFQPQATRTKQITRCFDYPLMLNLQEKMQYSMSQEIYSPLIEAALRTRLKNKKVFYDVGAHVGYFSALACSILPNDGLVVAFEPNPDRKESLKTLEEKAAKKFRFLPFGLSDRQAVLPFKRDSFNTGMSRLVRNGVASEGADQIQVFPLDHLIKTNSLPAPDVIKVDIEGHEMAFLKGAEKTIEQHRPTIVCELTEKADRSYAFEEFTAFLKKYRYRVLPLDHLGRKEISFGDLEIDLQHGNIDAILEPH